MRTEVRLQADGLDLTDEGGGSKCKCASAQPHIDDDGRLLGASGPRDKQEKGTPALDASSGEASSIPDPQDGLTLTTAQPSAFPSWRTARLANTADTTPTGSGLRSRRQGVGRGSASRATQLGHRPGRRT